MANNKSREYPLSAKVYDVADFLGRAGIGGYVRHYKPAANTESEQLTVDSLQEAYDPTDTERSSEHITELRQGEQ